MCNKNAREKALRLHMSRNFYHIGTVEPASSRIGGMSTTRRRSPLQFNLLSLFILTTVVAVLTWFAVTFGLDDDFTIIWVFPSSLIIAISASVLGTIYRKGAQRAFWIGFLLGCGQSVILGLWFARSFGIFREWEALMIVPFYCFCVPLACGWLGKYFHWLSVQPDPTPAPPSPASHAHRLGDGDVPGSDTGAYRP